MRSFRLTCVILHFLQIMAATLLAQPQEVKFERLSLRQGLAHNSQLSIIQDRKGFVWFATYDGIAKYDGYSFKLYNFDPYDSTTISQNLTLCLYEDSKGFIWAGTAGMGLNKFDPHTEQFTRYLPGPDQLNLITVPSVVEDPMGNIMIGTFGSLMRLDPEKDVFSQIALVNDSLGGGDVVVSMARDAGDTLWLGTTKGLYKLKIDVLDGHEIYSFERYQLGSVQDEDVHPVFVTAVHIDPMGSVWVGTTEGVARLDRKKQKFIRYQHDPANPQSLSHNYVNNSAITSDKGGNIWIGTNYGLNRLDPRSGKIDLFFMIRMTLTV